MNFVKNEILKMWIFGQIEDICPSVTLRINKQCFSVLLQKWSSCKSGCIFGTFCCIFWWQLSWLKKSLILRKEILGVKLFLSIIVGHLNSVCRGWRPVVMWNRCSNAAAVRMRGGKDFHIWLPFLTSIDSDSHLHRILIDWWCCSIFFQNMK